MPTLQDGRNAIDQGNLQQARLIFEALLQENARSTDAWLGLAEVLTETEDKRICYENVFKIDKDNRAAKDGLRSLEPQANPLVAALSQQTATPSVDEELDFMMDEEDEPTMVSARPADLDPTVESDNGPSMVVLVVVGLGLSVVAFAIGGGAVYFLITSLSGG